MSALMQWFAAPEWRFIVKALLHSVWQGGLVAVALALVLRKQTNPLWRYRCAFAAMIAVLVSGLVTWSLLSRPASHVVAAPATSVAKNISTPDVANSVPERSAPAVIQTPETVTSINWMPCVACAWLCGVALMLGRAAVQVAGAEQVRRTSKPVHDEQILRVLAQAEAALRLSRRVRMAVTERLTSPAVVGVLVPTLVFPLSLMNTLSPEQIRFIILHELAHIRRGDYFANLFQLFTEAILFFNPAVWWISHLIRREREACCDMLATQLSGNPADYARTLVHVAENMLSVTQSAALAFGEERETSSLFERVQRLLVPGYRPSLRLTWRAIVTSFTVAGGLLVLSAMGTRLTVNAILSPQQRMDRIERKLAEYKDAFDVPTDKDGHVAQVEVTAHIKLPDGSTPGSKTHAVIHSERSHASGVYGVTVEKTGLATYSVDAGRIWFEAEGDGYAPTIVGPFDGTKTNKLDVGDVVLQRGFDVTLQVKDSDTGRAITNVQVHASLVMRDNGAWTQRSYDKSVNDLGQVTFSHCADLRLAVSLNAPGYRLTDVNFDHLTTNGTLSVALKRGAIIDGTIVDKISGTPVANATVRIVAEKRDYVMHYGWEDNVHLLAKTDAQGHFRLSQLDPQVKYWFGFEAAGHESVLQSILPGENGVTIRLGPELVVHGRVVGDHDVVQRFKSGQTLLADPREIFDGNSYSDPQPVQVRIIDNVATFAFTNRYATKVRLAGAGITEERDITTPIDDWVIHVDEHPIATAPAVPKREVIFRFHDASGAFARGTVEVTVPDNLDPNHLTAHSEEKELTNNEVHVDIPIGGSTSVEPKHLIGYWFDRSGGNLFMIKVESGNGPMVVDVPLIPAGAIYAKARNDDGTPAGGLFFGVTALKQSPFLKSGSASVGDSSDGFSGTAPRKWASGPLPLGGTYQIHGWRGNSFCISKPVTLTEAHPDAEVEMQFTPTESLHGILVGPDEQPLKQIDLKVSFALLDGHEFGLSSVMTDEEGRFEIKNATPKLGDYFIEPHGDGLQAKRFKLKFSSDQMIRLQKGRMLAGQVVEDGTGYAIPDVEVRALHDGSDLPMQTTRTDSEGRFRFTSLGDGDYTVYVDGGQLLGDKEYRADGRTNMILRVKLYGWSKAKPKQSALK